MSTPTPTQPTQLTGLEKAEKTAAWILGLLATALGAATAIKGVVPAAVSAVLVAALPVVMAVERYLTSGPSSPASTLRASLVRPNMKPIYPFIPLTPNVTEPPANVVPPSPATPPTAGTP